MTLRNFTLPTVEFYNNDGIHKMDQMYLCYIELRSLTFNDVQILNAKPPFMFN